MASRNPPNRHRNFPGPPRGATERGPAREYQAIIAYVVYSQVIDGAEYTDIAKQLEIHAKQELEHANAIARQIDYLGKMPSVTPKPVKTSEKAKDMLKFDLENENDTIRNYRDRIRQCRCSASSPWPK